MRIFVWGALLTLIGCSSTGGDAQEVNIDLAPGASLVFEGPIFRSSAQSTSTLGISDVSVDGARIVVLASSSWQAATTWHFDSNCADCQGTVGAAGGGANFNLLVSEDLGATWTAHGLPLDTWQGWPLGAHASGGRVIIAGMFGVDRMMTLRELDLATDTWVTNPAIDGKQQAIGYYVASGSHLVSASRQSAASTIVTAYDVSTRTLTTSPASIGRDFVCNPHWNSPNGLQATTFCFAPMPDRNCAVIVSSTGELIASPCAPVGSWPLGTNQDQGQTMLTAHGLMRVGGDGVNAFATGFNVNGVLETVPLGAGSAALDLFTLHERFNTLIAMPTTFVEVPQTGDAQVFAAPSVCQGTSCGVSARTEWLLALPGGEMLAFFVVNSRKPDPGEGPAWHEHLYARKVTLTQTGTLGPVTTPSPVAAYPDAVHGTVAETGCVLAASCFGAERGACQRYWSALPDLNPARIAFLAAAASGTCAAMKEAWPEKGLIGEPACVPGCRGEVIVGCSAGKVSGAIDCRLTGTRCSPNGCVDPRITPDCGQCSTNAATCRTCVNDLAYSCYSGGGPTDCAAVGGHCAATSPAVCAVCGSGEVRRCEGQTAIQCTPVINSPARENCGDTNRVCADLGIGIGPYCYPKKMPATQCPGLAQPRCEGTVVVWCSSGEPHYVDCASLGFSRCVVDASSVPTCAP